MSDVNNSSQNEKAAKVRRKPERESVLTPTFAAARQPGPDRQQSHFSGGGLLQRQCSCGKHTIAGGVCEECQQKGDATSLNTLDDLSLNHPSDIQTARDNTTSFNLSHIPTQARFTANGQTVQPALTVNAPGDQYEQEADRVAESVMRVPAPPTPSTEFDSVSPSTVSRFPSISRIQTSDGNGTFQASPKVEARINQMQGNGQTLPAEEQDFFEERMGYDFSYVRVHTDANAVQASRDIQAKAFTVGNNIAFSEGTYRPGTDEGRRLLAHELTHVVQQISTRVQCKPKYTNASRSTFTSSSDIFHSSLLQHHQASYGFLQRQCACGKPILTGQECENCRKGQQETFPQGMSNNTTFNQASDQTVPINSLPPTNKTDFRNSMANISLETNTQNSIQRQVSGNQPSTPEEYLICLIMCACEVAPQVGSTGNLLRQQCVSQFLQMIERGMNYVTSFKAEVSYDMTSRPPRPIMSSSNPLQPHPYIPAWIKKHMPNHVPGSGMIRRPDVVLVNNPTLPPTQSNIRRVVEIKFSGDTFSTGQRTAYEMIAGSASKLSTLTPGPESCNCEELRERLVEVMVVLAEMILLSIAIAVLLADDVTGIGAADDPLLIPIGVRLTMLTSRLINLVPRLAPLFVPVVAR